ncbi:glycosyltransferase family 2 protein [Rheinheimera salexigens]|uniref:Glycosyltransferase 2-like domain-containing protein n=1 Tax=Rheinheimera salexigens TaxID=1628148 RepID=A0A1E7QA51_9GAMM|nr:glycosyltransferase family A protein [Rheinheimera salexigens]OEY70971.1 hypothetical protein BI198_06250 [Rheinheimera salexigens]
MASDIKVSVCVVTYNQEKYIAECLQSLVDQKTNFRFEIIVSDDCSSDRTQSIISEFAKIYPDIIKPIYRAKNIGGGENYTLTHAMAVGQYIAHMDGDDYALPGKLQNQNDYLDNNPECNFVWHPMRQLMPNDKFKNTLENKHLLYNKKFYKKDIIQFMAIGGNSSKMYRAKVRNIATPNFELLDYFINVEQVNDGYAAFSTNKPLGVYRTEIGVSSSGIKTKLILIKCFKFLSEKYPNYRLQINTANLTCLLVDGKNFRFSAWPFLKSFIMTFHVLSIFNFIKSIKIIKLIKN